MVSRFETRSSKATDGTEPFAHPARVGIVRNPLMSELISLGVDLGGTKTEAAVIARQGDGPGVRKNDDFRVLARRRVPTGSERGYAAVLETIIELVRETAREAGVDPKHTPIGVGMPGSVTRVGGLIKNSNTECLNGKPFRQDLARVLGGRVLFDNDANCFALAEARCGAARGFIDGVVFGVIMGTGVGGGLVVRGRLWGGAQGLGGEWGHHAVGPWRRLDAAVDAPAGGGGGGAPNGDDEPFASARGAPTLLR